MVKLTEKLVLARARASDLENVKKLNCWGSELTDVSIFREIPNIEVISLSVNNITNLEDFSHCANLTELYVRKNNIQDLSQIYYLKCLTKLRVLWLADNPCATGEKYRMTVLKMLPNLQKLDNKPVQPEEVNQAIEEGEVLVEPKSSSPCEPVIRRRGKQGKVVSPGSPVEEEKAGGDGATELSLIETNKIREDLGLRPLPAEKLSPAKTLRHHAHTSKARNANIVSAVLSLVKELDHDSLQTVMNACKDRMETF
ncbi:cilia- and flagella-associated protein 410-like [Saccoglossus kowalevskii]|uniref:Protein C21orf2-like n=1 Tax=Saccoglossus kowalevskii TaxID=10224 RepID=A0ABM0MHE0_SACKO|nr:PREDICTED: protein C21orf2-like [Saccoglossus kowalevskii]